MASSNPFRKSVMQPKATTESALPVLDPIDTTTQSQAGPPRTSFREAEFDYDDANTNVSADPEPQRKQPQQKPVKKVRVLTPPPLSPDSPEWPTSEPMYQMGPGLMPPPLGYDPFGGSVTDESDRDSTATPPYPKPIGSSNSSSFTAPPPPTAAPPTVVAGGPPGNPFSRTLQDIEDSSSKEELDLQRREEGEVLKAANAGAPALNVDAFKRLLLTGSSGPQGNQTQGDDAEGLADYNAQANKTIAAVDGVYDQQNHANNGSSNTGLQQGHRVVSPSTSTKDKKIAPPPPPPSSRHGRTIKNDQQPKATTQQPDTEQQHRALPEEYKPASNTQPQSSGADDDFESASDDDDDSSTDDASVSETTSAALQTSAKKPAPAPPPPRGHARTDTKTSINQVPAVAAPASFKSSDDDPPSRSSMDSMTTHRQDAAAAEKHRAYIPAPPPPRRPHVAPKQTSSTGPSPSISSSSIPQRNPQPISTDVASTSTVGSSAAAKAGKSQAPPRPPARNSSFARRPPSIHSAEGAVPRKMDGVAPPPPPPPPRHRGSSPAQSSRKSSADSRPEDMFGGRSRSSSSQNVDPSKGADILADLDALRREVEALRGGAGQ